MNQFTPDIQADIDAIGSSAAVPAILEVICSTTGMGFAAIALMRMKLDEKGMLVATGYKR